MTLAKLLLRRTARLLQSAQRLQRPTAPLCLTTLESRDVPSGFYTGTVFRDNNFDGAFTVANDQGFYKGVDVKAYNPAGALVASTQTLADGTYKLDTTGSTGPYRLELSVPAGFVAGPAGADNKSTIRFVANGGGSGLNFGLVNPLDYSQAAPDLFTSQFAFGSASSNAGKAAIVRFSYNASGIHDKGGNSNTTALATMDKVGSVYGLARQIASDTVYAGAFVRRFVGVGPGGTGAVYSVSGGTVTTLIDLNNVPAGMIPTGSVAADFEAGIDPRFGNPTYDYLNDTVATALTHRIGLGDLDISEDGSTLYIVNLFKRELVTIPINPTTGALDTSRKLSRTQVPLSVGNDALNFSNPQDIRPFAVSVHDGAVFVGETYTAETSGSQSTLRGYVFAFNSTAGKFESFDQTTNKFTGGAAAPVLSADLSYTRLNGLVAGDTFYDPSDPAKTITSGNPSERGRDDTFRPWDNTTPAKFNRRQQPLLSDIEFDRGVMVLGVRDRYGDLIGWNLPSTLPIGSGEGDILRAHPSGAGGFTLESNGVSNGVVNAIGGNGTGTQTFQTRGPGGGGQFYWSQYMYGSDGDENYGFGHSFTAMGGLYQVPGGTKIATTIMDPFEYSTGGISWFNNGTGTNEQDFELYAAGTGELGKANGLGDLQAFVGVAPVEIGNRIWLDYDGDGIQDAGEGVVAGLSVELWDLGADGLPGGSGGNADTLVATVTTDAEGNYYFSGYNNAGAGSGYKGGLALLTNRKYEVRIQNAEGGSQQPALAAFQAKLTVRDNDLSAGGDTRDSDATLVSGTTAVISVTTGAAGDQNHTFDAGFIPSLSLGNFVWEDANNNGKFDTGETKLKDVTVRLLDGNGNLITSQKTGANGDYLFNGLSQGKYIVEIVPLAGYVSSTGKNGSATGSHEPGVSGTQDSEDHGTTFSPTAIRTAVITLGTPGDTVANPDNGGLANLRQDFGIFRPLELGNFVWDDANNNGKFDAGETKLSLIPVDLLDSSGATVLASQKTDVNGNYLFGLLGAADYFVRITPPSGYVSSTGANGSATGNYEPGKSGTQDNEDHGTTNGAFIQTAKVTLFAPGNAGNPDAGSGGANTANLRQDFGIFRPLEVGNFVWDDGNNNGKFDTGEAKLQNVTVELLDSADLPITSQKTDVNGNYLFTNLQPGTYRVRITPPTGYVTSTGKANSHEPGVSGTQDNEDHGTAAAPFVQTAQFTLAAPGNAANPDTGSGGANSANLRQDFGLFQPYSLGNRVFLDLNNDGKLNGSDSGINGVTVNLFADFDGDGNFTDLVATKVTAGGGYYRFDGLSAGKYIVAVDANSAALAGLLSSTGAIGTVGVTGPYEPAPNGDTDNTDSDDNGTTAGTTVLSAVINLGPGGSEPINETDLSGGQGATDAFANMTIDFGFIRPVALGNRVWFDNNNNGTFDAGDTNGPTGVAVALLDSAGNPVLDKTGTAITTLTNSQGYYLFSGLNPGTYRLAVTAANFNGAGALVGFASSTGGGNGTTTGPNEPIAVIAGDNKDSGTTNGVLGTGGVRSVGVTLVSGTAPTNEEGTGTTPGIADTTADNDSNLAVDFGFIPVLSLGNRVFEDANNNGKFDAGEQPLGNLTVRLLDSAGNAVTDGAGNKITTTTNAQGYYLFTNLLAGNYIVEVVGPAGYVSSTGAQGKTAGPFEPGVGSGNDDQDHGTTNGAFFTPTSFRSGTINLAVGTAPQSEPPTPGITDPATDANSNATIDFGLLRPLSLGNRVWIDANNNGKFDTGEAAPGTVTVNLLDGAGNLLTTTTTNAQGYYLFTGLGGGTYRVEIDASNFTGAGTLVGFTSSTGGVGGTGAFEPVAGGKGNNDQDHGTISGTLGAGGSVRSGTVTLAAGTQTINDEGANGNTPGLTDPARDQDSEVTIDFGFFRPLSLGNRVWNDANNDGLDGGEQGFSNVTVNLLDGAGSKIATTTTNAQGYYLFTGLGEGTYSVEVDGSTLPGGASWLSSSGKGGAYEPAPSPGNQVDMDDNGTLVSGTTFRSGTVTLTVGGAPTGEPATPGVVDPARDQDSDATVDFGFFQPVSIGNLVWNDVNNNGVVDPGEPGLGEVPVRLFDSGGNLISSTLTAPDGKYSFSGLAPGSYYVEVDLPAGFVSSTGGIFGTGPYEAAPGPNNDLDNDDNGTTVTGQTVRSGIVDLTLGGEPTNDGDGPNGNATVDFGAFQPLSVGNLVFLDANNNGNADTGEAGIANVSVRIFRDTNADGTPDSPTPLGTTTTNAQGYYLFTGLGGDTYVVEITAPGTLISSSGKNAFATGPFEVAPSPENNVDSDDNGTSIGGRIIRSLPVTLAAGTEPTREPATPGITDNTPDDSSNVTVDFGLFEPLSVGDLVWNDTNNNCLVDPGEPGLAGVTVRIFDSAGNLLDTTTTAADGTYSFTNLVAGDYIIEVAPPTGFTSSTGGVNGTGPSEPAPSPNDDVNSDDNGTTNGTVIRSLPVTLTIGGEPSGNANATVDFGLFRPLSIGNLVWNDKNNNGTVDAGEPGLANVTVRLYRETTGDDTPDGAAITSVVTNASGSYLFTGLGEGRYIVEVDGSTLPAGMRSSSGKNATFTGPFEAAPSPENGTDNDDNGTGTVTIRSLPVTLSLGGEPTTEPATPGLADPARDADSNVTVDFGVFQPLAFGNTIWRDDNNNGKLDTNEIRFANITVQLTDPAGNVIATTTTDANGQYQFTALTPGDYIVRITPPPGVTPSTPVFPPLGGGDQQNIGTASGAFIVSPVITLNVGAAPIVGGNTDPNNYVIGDFGLLALAEVCGYVYRDPNFSGTYDRTTGDSPIGGVTITLTGVDAAGNSIPARTTITDATGFYCFRELPPGTYTIRETQPGELLYDFIDTVGNLGGTAGNDVLTVTLAPNQSGQNYNFSEVPPADPFGYVWVDLNRNCIRDPGEPGIPGVPVSITGIAFAGTPLARPLTAADVPGGLTRTTDINGRYDFLVMPPGLYTISEVSQPAGYEDGCEQNGDPNQPAPGVGNDVFTNLRLDPNPIRGPFNFGEFVPAGTTFDPTKRQFLGSTRAGTAVPQGAVGNPAPGTATATRANLPLSPRFSVTTGNPTVPTLVATAAGAGTTPEVRVFNYATGGEQLRFLAYEATFTGGVRVATGDVNRDGIEDVITGIGLGGGPRIRVFNGSTGTPIYDFFAYEPTFTGGLFVASADVTGDGFADIITGVDTGGGPRIQIFDGRTGATFRNFFAFDANQRGGVRVAAADVNGDGVADIVATTGAGVPTAVRVFNAATLDILAEITPYTSSFTGGVSLAAGDVNGDGFADIITGADAGGGPHVQIFDGRTRTSIASFFAYESSFTGGVRVGAADVDGDGKADVITAPGAGGSSRVRVLRAADQFEFDAFYPLDPEFTGGVFIG